MVSLDSLDSTLKKSLVCKGGGVRRGLPPSSPKLLYMCSEDRQNEFEEFNSKMRYPPKKVMEMVADVKKI